MKFSGHTMGTPERSLHESMQLFKEIGFDGIEIRCAADGHLDPLQASPDDFKEIRAWQQELDSAITCLTPYFKNFVTDDGREETITSCKKVVDAAAELECPNVRLYGGLDPTPPGYSLQQNWQRTASGIRTVAEYAAPRGVRICIETHIGSLTMSAADTVKMIQMVDMANVGILFDFAWIYYAGKEDCAEAVQLCAPYIFHCHYKDWVFDRQADQKEACLMGEGSLPWQAVFEQLIASGYNGTFTDEYEKYWNRDSLPDADIGMRSNLEYVKSLIEGSTDEN